MSLTLALLMSAVPHFSSGPGTLINNIGFFPVIFEGEVLLVQARPDSFDTILRARATSYLQGSGPDTVGIQLGWINDGTIVTEVVGHGAARALQVPTPGDRGIFFLGTQVGDEGEIPARLSSDAAIWEIESDSLTALGMSLEEGRRMIQEAAREAALATHLPLAQTAVVGHIRSRSARADPHSRELGFTLLVEDQVKGSPLSDTLITFAPGGSKKPWPRGLYLLSGPDSLGRYSPVHPAWYCFPAMEGRFVVGYRLESRETIDHLVPITVGKDKHRTWK